MSTPDGLERIPFNFDILFWSSVSFIAILRRITPELTHRPQAAFNLHQNDHHEKIATGRLGSMSCYGGAQAFRRAERLLIFYLPRDS
jgi:hypothetical protein